MYYVVRVLSFDLYIAKVVEVVIESSSRMAPYLGPMYSISYLYQYVHKLATKHTILAKFIACLVSKQSDIRMCVIYVCPVTCY